jgi:hypothetical protein
MVTFDCETYRIPTAADFLEPVVVDPIKPDKRFTDPAKIAADIATKEAEREAEIIRKTHAQLDACSIDPYLSRIVSLGWCWPGDEIVTIRTCPTEAREAEALREFWAVTVDPSTKRVVPLVGFNSRSFDLPLLMVRSRFLGVDAPILNIDRWKSPHPDVMLALTFNGALKPHKLSWYGKRFGLNVEDAFSGKEIAGLVEDGNWDAIAKHNEADVLLTRGIAERLGIIRKVGRVF